jgi:hypothetical protein
LSILRRLTDLVLQNRWYAVGAALLSAGIPLLGGISVLIAGLVTLRKGAIEGALVFFAAIIPSILQYYFVPLTVREAKIAFIFLGCVIIRNFLVWVFAVLLRRYSNWSLILECAILLGIVAIGMLHFFYPAIQSWWGQQLTAYFNKVAAVMQETPGYYSQVRSQADIFKQLVTLLQPYASGLIITSCVLLNALLQLGAARWWQAAIFNPGGLRKELYEIRLSKVIGILFVIGLVFSYRANAVALDIMPVFYSLFCIAGLSLVHNRLALVKYSWFWLIVIYVVAVLLFPESANIFAVIALLDIAIDFRKRFA